MQLQIPLQQLVDLRSSSLFELRNLRKPQRSEPHLQVNKPAGDEAALEAPFTAIAGDVGARIPGANSRPPVACLLPAAAAVGLAAEYAGEQVVEPAHLGALHLIGCLAALLDGPADCVRHAAGLVAVGAEPAAVALGATGLGAARAAAVEDLPHAALAEPQAEKEQAPASPRIFCRHITWCPSRNPQIYIKR